MKSPKSMFTAQREFTQQKHEQTPSPAKATSAAAVPTVHPYPQIPDEKSNTVVGSQTYTHSPSIAVRRRSAAATTTSGPQLSICPEGTGTKETGAILQGQPLSLATDPAFRTLGQPCPISALLPYKPTDVSKRRREEDHDTEPDHLSKRRRPPLIRARQHILEPEGCHPNPAGKGPTSPPSPLFFSHSPRRRPIPINFSSSEAAEMLNRARDEPGGIKTLKLARGSMTGSSPPRSAGSSNSFERRSISQSPHNAAKSSPGWQALGSVGIIDLLEQDDRMTFVVDLADRSNFVPGTSLQLVFANAAIRAYDSVLEMVTGKTDLNSPGVAVTNDFPEFKAWVLSYAKNGESLDVCLPSFTYGGFTWNCSTLKKRLRIISGSNTIIVASTVSGGSSIGAPSNPSNERVRGSIVSRLPGSPLVQSTEPSDYFGDATHPFNTAASPLRTSFAKMPTIEDSEPDVPKQAMLAYQTDDLTREMMQSRYPETSSFDWTRLSMSAALPKHIQFARSIDWASTPLGPIENWTFDLRAMCNLIMGSPHPAAMYWGDEYIAIYNEAYILLAGQKHPQLMGQSYKTAWAEIWPEIEDVFASAKQSGQSTMKDDDCLFIKRNGYLEESYFSWSIIPLVGEDGSVVGLYNPCFEKTRRRIAERRMLTLREVGERTATARDIKGFWGQVIKGLEYNDYDVPFAFLYSVGEDVDSDLSSMHSGSLAQAPQCILEGTLGVPVGHKASISPLDLKNSDESFAPYLREATMTNKTILLTTEEGTLSEDLIDGLEWRGFGDPCRAAIVCPIHPTTGETILGFLIMGINPRRPYDDDYSLFIQLLSRQLATSMASVVLFEDEIRRGQRAAQLAALDRQELSKQLDLRTQEAVESETRFTRMAELAPVGMFIADESGKVTYSNDTWWEISRHPRAVNSANTWMDSIKDEDRAGVEMSWKKLVNRTTAVTHEFRFKTPWQDRNGNRGDTWVLMSAYPERDEDGKLKSVFGSITNISQQKMAEDFQKRRMEEAIELKRQQENFIDMTSHEMRNPLSAILQCSDEITGSLNDFKFSKEAAEASQVLIDTLDSSIDASQTIALCAQHQKRIVDDILTLSKLDSALLVVTPVAVQPISVVQRALKMFEGELDTNDIGMDFKVEPSYLDLAIDWVKLDPSRLLQVLINLTTNAIKFTHGQDKRTIVVTVGASKERPSSSFSGMAYFPSLSKRKDLTTDDAEWGDGDEVFLHFAVQDTGRGLSKQEMALLFQRFSQASPRTHVQYGGSGLGLFISRELTELQGGSIGVASEPGVGSTFAFYVKARTTESPTGGTPIATAVSSLRRNSSNSAITIDSRQNSTGKGVQRYNTTGHRKRSTATPPKTSPPLPSPSASSSISPTQLRILVVEDNLVNQRVLQKSLKNRGFTVDLANHGGEALEILKTSNFWKDKHNGIDVAVVLMDLEMPVMDGLTCTRKIREFEADGTIVRHVPIIAVTANARLEQIETALSAGMDNVVSKPFRMPELIPKIEDLVKKSKAAAMPSSESNTTSKTEKTEKP